MSKEFKKSIEIQIDGGSRKPSIVNHSRPLGLNLQTDQNGSIYSLSKEISQDDISQKNRRPPLAMRSPRRVDLILPTRESRRSMPLSEMDRIHEDEDENDDIAVDPTHLDPYLQALSTVQFNWRPFLFELCTHLFQPLAMVLIFSKQGRNYLYNRGFIGPLLALNCLYYIYCRSTYPIFEIILVNMFFGMRMLIIATKYAFVPELERRESLSQEEGRNTMSERQVITGWGAFSESLVQTQLLYASVRQKVDLTMANFDFCKREEKVQLEQTDKLPTYQNDIAQKLQAKYAGQSLERSSSLKIAAVIQDEIPSKEQSKENEQAIKEEAIHRSNSIAPQPEVEKATDKPRTISAWDLAFSLIKESCHIKFQGYWTLIVAFIYSFLPLLVRVSLGKSYAAEDTSAHYAITWLSVYLNFFLMWTNCAFLLIAKMDTHQREYRQRRLNAILFDGYITNPEVEPHFVKEGRIYNPIDRLIRLDMTKPKNIMAWWYTRLVLQHFGLVYYNRINIYCAYFVMLSIGMIAVIFFEAFTGGSVDPSSIAVAIFVALFVILCINSTVFYGGRSNEIRKHHCKTLIQKKLDLMSQIMNYEEKLKAGRKAIKNKPPAHAQGCKEMLETIVRAVELDNQIFSVRLLGFKASSDLIEALSGVLVAGIAAAVKILFKL